MDRLKQLEKKLAKVSPLGLVGTNPATYTPKNVMKQSVRFERKVVPIISTVVRNDYESADMKTRYELKSRKINHNQFPTILISHRKIIKGSSNGCDLVLLFLFLDGLYFIRYEPMLFSNFDIGDFVRYRDGQGEKDTVIHIPIKHLTKINL